MKSELTHAENENNIVLEESDEEGTIFDNLRSYLKYLYLKPYVGRKIKVLNENIECESLADRLKKDEIEGKIKKMELTKLSNIEESFSTVCLYHVLDKAYGNKKVTLYSENRLISSFDFSNEMLCGIA